MQLLSLSASSGQAYEDCPAQWKALYERKYSAPGGSAANLGSVDHAAFERWVTEGHYKNFPTADVAALGKMTELVQQEYYKLFSDRERLDEAVHMAVKWLKRQDWSGRTVLAAETKMSFPLATSIGDVPFNFIWDRVDSMDDGKVIEVVDYKSVSMPVRPEDLKHRIQPRSYAVAAHKLYPDAQRIWITFDLLRYEPVGIVFTAEECEETELYLHALAERILADNEAAPTINDKCRWCPVKWECPAIKAYVERTSDPLAFGTIAELASNRAALKSAIDTMSTMLSDVDAILTGHLGAHNVTEAVESDEDGTEWKFGISTTRRRTPPAITDLAPIIGAVEAIKIAGAPTLKSVDALLASGDLDADQQNNVKRLIGWSHTAPSMKVTQVKHT